MSQITLADSGELPASRLHPGSGERQQAVFFPGSNPPLHHRPWVISQSHLQKIRPLGKFH
jgi:hypothetical protein